MDKMKIFPAIQSIKDGMFVLPLLKQNFYRQQWRDYLPRMKKTRYLNQPFEKDRHKFGRSSNNGIKPTLKVKRE
jgi:hypothetical protein